MRCNFIFSDHVCQLWNVSTQDLRRSPLRSGHKNVQIQYIPRNMHTVFCFAVLCCGYTLTDFPISIKLTSLALWQSNDCHSASKATLMNMDKYFMWIHYERLHNHNKAKHNKTVCIFLGIYCISGKMCMFGTFTATSWRYDLDDVGQGNRNAKLYKWERIDGFVRCPRKLCVIVGTKFSTFGAHCICY